jgi:hypothetical protein
MRRQKYIDMAYSNPKGQEWLRTLHRTDFWNQWCTLVKNASPKRWYPDISGQRTRAEKIVVAAIWHFGFANDSPRSEAVRRTCGRLRNPPDKGGGVDLYGTSQNAMDYRTFGMPREFWWLEEFLEYTIRPHLDSSDKRLPGQTW